MNNETYFFAKNGSNLELYKTNGTTAGTVIVKAIANLGFALYSYPFNGKIYFVATNSIGGAENLYQTDGTTIGTLQISPNISMYATNPNGFNVLGFGNELYFGAIFGSQGNEFCKLSNLLNNTDFDFDNDVTIYPNPTNAEINFKFKNNLENVDLKIFNVQGKMVKNFEIKSNQEKIDVSFFKSGIYYFVFDENGQKFIKKVVKN